MECYNYECDKECDIYKRGICLFRLTKEQADLINDIKGPSTCKKCGGKLIKGVGKYSREHLTICISCRNIVKKDKKS